VIPSTSGGVSGPMMLQASPFAPALSHLRPSVLVIINSVVGRLSLGL